MGASLEIEQRIRTISAALFLRNRRHPFALCASPDAKIRAGWRTDCALAATTPTNFFAILRGNGT
jgi:hypothetical protein